MVLINHYQYLYQNLTIIVCTYLLKLRCVIYVLTFYLELVSFIFSILWFTNSREFNDPNFGFSDSCTKKKALIKKVHSSTQCKIHRSLSRQVQFVENVNEIVWNILPTPRLQSRAQPHPILYFLKNSAHLSCTICAKNFSKFRSGYHFRGQKIFGGHKRLLKKYKAQILQILRNFCGFCVLRPHLATTFRTRTFTSCYFAHLEVILRTRTYFT
jgi:hypothetical protein